MENKQYTQLQMIALTALRVLVGWHFLYEGVAKLLKGTWSAAGYLSQSKWIFAPIFHWMADTPGVLAVINQLNMWGLVLIGLGLILGVFTRYAAWAGMALIMLYYLANPPLVGLFYSIPMEGNYLVVNKNLVEFGALFVISLTGTGKFAGLDRLFCKK